MVFLENFLRFYIKTNIY